jgi:peptidoglycan glycosyltransferase
VLYEQRIVRGRILDRDGDTLANIEVAPDGVITRRYLVIEAVPPIGYASLRYGTGGIEAAFDAELRGEAGRSAWQSAWDELLHRYPHGHDVQLTLDAALQVQAQQALHGQAGAIVLLDTASGEILALASSPTFDPHRLDETWEALSQDPSAPLVNRATQGLYQPGAILQTIILAEALHPAADGQPLADLTAPTADATAAVPINGTLANCDNPDYLRAAPSETHTLAAAYAAACPAPFADLGERLGADGLERAFQRWPLTTPPSLEIPTESADWDDWLKLDAEALATPAALRTEAIGQGQLTVSPLQMALVAGTLANEGTMPAPRLVLRVQNAAGDWQERPSAGEERVVLTPDLAHELLAAWPQSENEDGSSIAVHHGTAIAGKEQPPHAWFLGVAPADAPRYAVAVLLEHPADPHQAVEIGNKLLETASASGF